MGEAYGILSDSSGALSVDLGSANDQFSKVLLMMSDAVNGAANHEIFEDISEQLGQEDTEGRVSENRNLGTVEGDSNVGGVIGSMGIEYEFDMEDRIIETVGVNGIVNKTYESHCVSDNNVNYGAVTGRKDRIGGVVGSSETGTVTDCEDYGSVSTEGSYAGGIAGYSGTSIRGSYAMCTLSGSKYVGGIAGYGSTITDCATMVELSSSQVCAGAIAGWADIAEEGAIDRNIYVHDSLGAVDGISYADKAAPVSYEELIAREGVPEAFRSVTVSFLADGALVEAVKLPYGGALDAGRIPAVPEKPGYTGSWAEFETENLRFNSTVEAVYVLNQHTVAVDTTRPDSPLSILLVEGDFREAIRVSLTPYAEGRPEGMDARELWTLRLEGYTNPDGEGYTVRFLMPAEEPGSQTELYRLEDGAWTREDADDPEVIFAVVRHDAVHGQLIPWILAAAAALILLIAIPLGVARSRKKKAAARAERPAEE